METNSETVGKTVKIILRNTQKNVSKYFFVCSVDQVKHMKNALKERGTESARDCVKGVKKS